MLALRENMRFQCCPDYALAYPRRQRVRHRGADVRHRKRLGDDVVGDGVEAEARSR